MSPIRSTVVRCRRMLVRRPWIYWLLVVAVSIALAASVFSRLEGVDAARRSWGTTQPVLIAATDTAPGAALIVRIEHVPMALVPESAVDAAQAGSALIARQHIAGGEIVTELDVSPAITGVLALVPSGWRVTSVIENPPSAAQPGDHVELVSDGVVIAAKALMIGVQNDTTLIATPADVAPAVALAAHADTLTVLLVS